MAEKNIDKFETEGYPVRILRRVRSKKDGPFGTWQTKTGAIEIIYVVSGSIRLSGQKKFVKAYSGEACVLFEDSLYRLTSTEEEETVYVSIEFEPEMVVGERNEYLSRKYYDKVTFGGTHECVVLHEGNISGETAIDKIKDIIRINDAKKPGYELLIKANLCMLWAFFIDYVRDSNAAFDTVSLSSRDELRVKTALSFMRENYKEPITLNDIAAKIHVGPNECLRCFKRILNMSPIDYLIRFRIFRAARTLYKDPESVDTISELALESGFNNVSYFNRAFKREFSCTPTEFQKLLKANDRGIRRTYGRVEKELTLQTERYDYDRQ